MLHWIVPQAQEYMSRHKLDLIDYWEKGKRHHVWEYGMGVDLGGVESYQNTL